MDVTNPYVDEDDDGDDEEESSGEDDTQMETEIRAQMEEARDQYDKQLGELYKRNRENAVKLREEA